MSTDKVQLFSFFLTISILGSLLLSCPFAYRGGQPVPYIDALFLSVSAVCVTGLSSVDMSVFSSAGFIVLMCLIELGGLGLIAFISFYIAVPRRKMSLVNRAVVRDFFIDDVESEPRRILKAIIAFTLAIEGVSAAILYCQFKDEGSARPLLDAVFHSVSAFCNAGLSTYQESLCPFVSNPVIQIVIMMLIVSGGIGFIVLTDIAKKLRKGKRRRLSFHTRTVLTVTAILIVGGAVMIYLIERNAALSGLGEGEKILAALFSSITPRTAGFSVIQQNAFSPLVNLLITVLMFIGGSPGSIAGGIKTTTFTIVLIYAIRGNTERNGMNVFRRNVDSAIIEKAFSIFAKSMMIIIVSLALLLYTERASLQAGVCTFFDLLFEDVSAFGTVGLSLGITASLSSLGKLVVIATMFIGRTGIFAMALGFAHGERESLYEYPSASVLVG